MVPIRSVNAQICGKVNILKSLRLALLILILISSLLDLIVVIIVELGVVPGIKSNIANTPGSIKSEMALIFVATIVFEEFRKLLVMNDKQNVQIEKFGQLNNFFYNGLLPLRLHVDSRMLVLDQLKLLTCLASCIFHFYL